MTQPLQQVVVLGGGSAGWLVAGLLAAEHGVRAGGALQITLLESPAQPPIGVGEGTWPSMRDTLRRIGLRESDLVQRCDAAFKQGSQFVGWATGQDGDAYFHPFTLPVGHGDADLPGAWLAQHAHLAFADLVSPQPHLCRRHLAPKQASTPEFAAVANYGYHFDAGKFGLLLREHATVSLGVRHVADDMVDVCCHDNGDIAALRTRAHGNLAGDLFIDCSGLAARLLGAHYGVPLRSQRSVLFNDRALAVQVPHADVDGPLASQTVATAQPNGWVWDIALPTRRGVGHVYSSAHTSDDAAEAMLRQHIQRTGGPTDPAPARRLRFEPGYRSRFWHRNCVAIGLSSGFIEPLEASALALVELSAAMLSAQLPATRCTMDTVAAQFNDAFRYRWERVIDFLKLHYVLSRRTDTDYWRDHVRADSVPERLRALLSLWRHRAPSRWDLPRIEEVFPAASHQYVLYGMGFRPDRGGPDRRGDASADPQACFREAAIRTQRLLSALPTHRALVSHIQRHGMPII